MTARLDPDNEYYQADPVTATVKVYIPVTKLSAVQYQWGSPAPGYSYASWPIFESWMRVQILNSGPADARNVVATISSTPPNVQVVNGSVGLGNIATGQSGWSTDAFRIRTDMAHPADRCAGITWRIEYDDALGEHRVFDNVPQFPPGQAPGGCP